MLSFRALQAPDRAWNRPVPLRVLSTEHSDQCTNSSGVYAVRSPFAPRFVCSNVPIRRLKGRTFDMPAIFGTNASDSWKNSIRHVLNSIAVDRMQRHNGGQARISAARLLLAIVCTVAPLAGQTAPPALPWTALEPGVYPVGYRVLYEFDRSRTWHATRCDGAPFSPDENGRPV